ncbi:MAG: transposase, partial [Bacteroidetes bacterium]|nr:transposase [Bacteroidota bacterium]
GYNIQASSDSKHKFLAEYDTGNVNDTNALADIAINTKELLGVKHMNALADKGYHTGAELSKCRDHGITTYVSPKAPSTKDIGLYPITSFTYDPKNDLYVCPQGHQMRTNNTWYRHSDKRKSKKGAYSFRRYNTPACKICTSRHLCTQSKTNGRYIDRSEYAEVVEANAERVTKNPEYYRQRQQVTEHMFGTLKRQRGFTHTLVRGKDNVLGEVGLMFIGYNLSRCISVIGMEEFIKALKECCLAVFLIKIRLILRRFRRFLEKIAKLLPGKMKNFYAVKPFLFNSKDLYLYVN